MMTAVSWCLVYNLFRAAACQAYAFSSLLLVTFFIQRLQTFVACLRLFKVSKFCFWTFLHLWSRRCRTAHPSLREEAATPAFRHTMFSSVERSAEQTSSSLRSTHGADRRWSVHVASVRLSASCDSFIIASRAFNRVSSRIVAVSSVVKLIHCNCAMASIWRVVVPHVSWREHLGLLLSLLLLLIYKFYGLYHHNTIQTNCNQAVLGVCKAEVDYWEVLYVSAGCHGSCTIRTPAGLNLLPCSQPHIGEFVWIYFNDKI